MTAAVITFGIGIAMGSFGVADGHHHWRGDYQPTAKYLARQARGQSHFLPPYPGDGVGFPNDDPDLFGWIDEGTFLPLGADRTPEYYFPRYFSAPPDQLFLETYWNPFTTAGQRYLPYCGAGGDHPAGHEPLATADLPVSPYQALPDTGPIVPVPRLRGRVEAAPITSGGSGLTP